MKGSPSPYNWIWRTYFSTFESKNLAVTCPVKLKKRPIKGFLENEKVLPSSEFEDSLDICYKDNHSPLHTHTFYSV